MLIPEWSDLGNVSPATRMSWEGELAIRHRYRYYFDGLIFKEKVPTESGNEEDAPLLYPVGINLVKMLCLAMTDSEFGEWQERIINFEVRKDLEADEAVKSGIELLAKISESSSINSMLWEMSLDRNMYGGGAAKVSVDLTSPGYIKWERIPLENFFPVCDPDDPNKLLEVYVVVEMSAEQAKLRYGYAGSTAEIIQRVEHWTPEKYENTLDGQRMDAYSGVNPYGFVPFTFVPRFRTTHWWGDAITEDVIPVQDELNMRVADLGDAINYNSHPVRWGMNLPKAFNSGNFPLDSNAMWDAGRSIGNTPPPQFGVLEAKNPVPQGAFEYIKFLYDWARTSSFAPPIAFGEDSGGGQRSGVTLEIRMWPLIKSVRRSRAYLGEGISRMMKMSARMLQQKKLPGISALALKAIVEGLIVPTFAEIMPRDHQAIVDEVVKRFSTTPPSISIDTAVDKLGDGIGEVDRIKTMMQDKVFFPPAPKPTSNPISEGVAGKAMPQAKKDVPE